MSQPQQTQKLLVKATPEALHAEVNEYLEQGWRVVPGTHVASWENVAGEKLDPARAASISEGGYFAIAVENVPPLLMLQPGEDIQAIRRGQHIPPDEPELPKTARDKAAMLQDLESIWEDAPDVSQVFPGQKATNYSPDMKLKSDTPEPDDDGYSQHGCVDLDKWPTQKDDGRPMHDILDRG